MPKSITDTIQAFRDANPDAVVWLEEVLMRGAPGTPKDWGTVTGAHVNIGVQRTGPTGEITRQVFGPYPVSVTPGDSELAKVLGAVALQQQATIETHEATIAEKEAAIKERETAIAAKDAEIEAKAVEIEQLRKRSKDDGADVAEVTAVAEVG